MGSGDVVGLMPALVGEVVPGHGPALAVGNALGHGPIVFHLPQPVVEELARRAPSDLAFQQLHLDLHRSPPPNSTRCCPGCL